MTPYNPYANNDYTSYNDYTYNSNITFSSGTTDWTYHPSPDSLPAMLLPLEQQAVRGGPEVWLDEELDQVRSRGRAEAVFA